MVAGKKSWPRVIAAAALACTCLGGALCARAEEQRSAGNEPLAIGDGVTIRSGPQKDVIVEPPAALVRFNVPGRLYRERAWDVAAHASAGNDIRFQRAFFVSAHMRF
jgi:hypothetical protein